MDSNKIALSSLALDLKRVALGYYRGSDTMADRFLEEALKREKEVDRNLVKPYIRDVLDQIKSIEHRKNRRSTNKMDIAEDALMYSTLLQNAANSYG